VLRLVERALVEAHRRHVHEPRVMRLAAALAGHVGRAGSLLDVGAGTGQIARRVGEQAGAARVEGVDVLVRGETEIPVRSYDGRTLPYRAGEFEVVLLVDVLHHTADPRAVLRECLRVARRAVVVKDHFAFGPATSALLWAMDRVGNHGPGVAITGRYFSLPEWVSTVQAAHGSMESLTWPVHVHAPAVRLALPSSLHFVASVVPLLAATGDA
jgi:SAM-dependent methyltransferase